MPRAPRNQPPPPAQEPAAAPGAANALPDALVLPVKATGDVRAEDVKAMLAQIEDLKKKLGIVEGERDAAEAAALAAAEAQGMLLQREIREVSTGKTVKVKRAFDKEGNPTYKCVGYKEDGREIMRPVMHEHELPTFFYKIDIPPVGGIALVVNGIQLYHGGVYKLDLDSLRSTKEQVFRLWDHDRNIMGSNENAYRKPQDVHISMRG